MTTHHTIADCLATLEIAMETLEGCESLQFEFAVIKKAYFKKVLVCHPDKGGDAAVFRTVHASFEALRDMYDNGRVQESFVTTAAEAPVDVDDNVWQEYENMPPQSWDYFWEAAGEEIPGYCVELAKSGRSSCKQKTKCRKQCTDVSIGFGEIRCGSLDDMSGGYTRWNHLNCWAVPAKIWLGLPDPDECDDPEQFSHALLSMNEVSLCGFSGLPEEDKATFVEYVMDKTHWAAWQNRKPKKNDAAIVPSAVGSSAGGGDVVPEGYHQARERFVVPVPGKDGAIAGILEGKTIVLTGVFPEVGGGRGLSLGKDKVKAMVQKFGGRVTSSVSGKTDYLIVGKEAGHSKVSKARESKKCIVMSLKDLKEVCEGVATLEDVASKPLFIPQFSSGYGGSSALVAASGPMLIHQNGSAASDADKKPAAKRKSLEDDGDKKPAAKKPKKSKAAGKKKPVKRAPKKKTKKEEKENVRNEESDNEDEPVKQDIKCDVCEVDCTKQSWYDEDTGEDYCVSCREGRGVLQCDGINVE